MMETTPGELGGRRLDSRFTERSGCLQKFTSCRWSLAFILCLLRMCQTALRQNIGMSLVCMSERPPVPGSQTSQEQNHLQDSQDNGRLLNTTRPADCSNGSSQTEREFMWGVAFEGLVLSSYYYGYLLTPLVSSYLERVVGAKRLVATSVGLGAVVNLLTPEATRLHQYLLVALRVLAGMTNGMIDPAVQTLWAAWAPRSEVAHLTSVEYTGVSLGGIFTFLISGLLCQIPWDNGWPFVFYFYGSMSLVWVGVWLSLVHNSPGEHPHISAEERKYILSETQSSHTDRPKMNPPWLQIFTSPAVWAVVVATATFTWVYSWVLAYLPMYMQDVLRYNITQNAMLSSLPFVGKFLTGLACGLLADRLLRTRLSVSCNRKLFQIVGCIGCSACTMAIGFLDYESRNLAVVLLILAVASQNISTVAFRINALDIAPRYSGFILGLANTLAVAVSLTAPLITSAVITQNTREQWQVMFYVVTSICLVGGVVFLLLGEAELQAWARTEALSCAGPEDMDDSLAIQDSQDIQVFTNNNNKLSSIQQASPESPFQNDEENSDDDNDYNDHDGDNVEVAGTPIKKSVRQAHRTAMLAARDLDAGSQWSSTLSLTS